MKKEPSTHPRDQPPHFHFSFLLLDFTINQRHGKRKYLSIMARFVATAKEQDHWIHCHSKKDGEESTDDLTSSVSMTLQSLSSPPPCVALDF